MNETLRRTASDHIVYRLSISFSELFEQANTHSAVFARLDRATQ